MKKLYTIVLFAFVCTTTNAQSVWTQKANFGGVARSTAVSFTIGTKGYIGTGLNGSTRYNDFWEWDQPTNVWTQKANFGGTARAYATGFSIGAKGYIGTGSAAPSTSVADFWEWNQATNTWTQKANYSGGTRMRSVGFAIGNKGYIGTGYSFSTSSYYKDFWEYDPSTDIWTQKANFGGTARNEAVGFSIGSKGYIGTGYDGANTQDFWEYNSSSDTWVQKANFGGTARNRATGFSIGTQGYIGTGWDVALENDFWKWDQATNTWSQINNFAGSARQWAMGFSIGTKGYVGTGSTGQDFWEWAPTCALNIAATNTTITAGTNVSLSANYTPSSNNIIYSWSPASGLSNTTISNPIATPTISTTYTLVAQDTVLQCSRTASVSIAVNIEGCWMPKANLGGAARQSAVGFSIGTKGYIGTGVNDTTYYKDFWEWDQATNVWTQKANFGGAARSNAVGFSIGTKGYIGTGVKGAYPNDIALADFWEWDQATNTWTQKTNFPGLARCCGSGFSIGTKGYIGIGEASIYSLTNYQDFWEWDQATNTWTQKSDFGGGTRRNAVGFSIGTKGYIGTGIGGSLALTYNDFYEFDPAANTWTQKANYGGTVTTNGVGFSIGTKGYIEATYNYLWEWDQTSNIWMQKAFFSGTKRGGAVGFSIGNKGYFGTGSYGSANIFNDFWEWNSNCDLPILGSHIVCIGSSESLDATLFPQSNNVSYNWMPSSGLNSTTVPNPVATPTANVTYTVTAIDTITKNAGTAILGITLYPIYAIQGCSYPICSGEAINLCASGGTSYSWSSGQTTGCITNFPATTITYTVGIWNSGCYAAASTTVIVNCSGNSACNNHDFENGNFQGWNEISGSNDSYSTPYLTLTGGINCLGNDVSASSNAQHTILTINKLDSFAIDSATNVQDIFMTTIAPNGGNYSVRLGNAIAGSGAEGLRIQFTPTNSDNIFYYQFALVLQNAGHITKDEPGFIVNVYNASLSRIASLCDTIYGPDPIVPFLHVSASAPDPSVLYKRWTNASLNLSAYIGQTVTIEFINFDCAESGHWGYTYLDAWCNNLTGIPQFFYRELISIYPNPTSGSFIINSTLSQGELEIYNVLGEKVYSSIINSQSSTINLDVPNGIYFLQLKTEQGVTTKKLIINK